MGKDLTLTSVKVPTILWEDFKVEGIRQKMTFQKLAERALFLYVTNGDFRKNINNTLETFYTGSI